MKESVNFRLLFITILFGVFHCGSTENGKSIAINSFMQMSDTPSRVVLWSTKSTESTFFDEEKQPNDKVSSSSDDEIAAYNEPETPITFAKPLPAIFSNQIYKTYEDAPIEEEFASMNDMPVLLDNKDESKEDFIKEKDNYLQKMYAAEESKNIDDTIVAESKEPAKNSPLSAISFNPFGLTFFVLNSLARFMPTSKQPTVRLAAIESTTSKPIDADSFYSYDTTSQVRKPRCTCNDKPCSCNRTKFFKKLNFVPLKAKTTTMPPPIKPEEIAVILPPVEATTPAPSAKPCQKEAKVEDKKPEMPKEEVKAPEVEAPEPKKSSKIKLAPKIFLYHRHRPEFKVPTVKKLVIRFPPGYKMPDVAKKTETPEGSQMDLKNEGKEHRHRLLQSLLPDLLVMLGKPKSD